MQYDHDEDDEDDDDDDDDDDDRYDDDDPEEGVMETTRVSLTRAIFWFSDRGWIR